MVQSALEHFCVQSIATCQPERRPSSALSTMGPFLLRSGDEFKLLRPHGLLSQSTWQELHAQQKDAHLEPVQGLSLLTLLAVCSPLCSMAMLLLQHETAPGPAVPAQAALLPSPPALGGDVSRGAADPAVPLARPGQCHLPGRCRAAGDRPQLCCEQRSCSWCWEAVTEGLWVLGQLGAPQGPGEGGSVRQHR